MSECIYCGQDAGAYDEHEACFQRSVEKDLHRPLDMHRDLYKDAPMTASRTAAPKNYRVKVRVIGQDRDDNRDVTVDVTATNSHDADARACATARQDHPGARGYTAISRRRVQA